MKAKKREAREVVARMEGVGRSFGARDVLSDVSLEVRRGEVLGVVGPNGGGKSTLLLLLAGLLVPTRGSVAVVGHAAHRLALEAAGLVGLVTARPGLYPLLTGRENLHHFGGLFGLAPHEVDAKAAPLATALAIESALDARVATWSTGMQQKLSLVRALLLSPKLLLLDEPTANLDPPVARTLYAEIRRRADAGLACVLVTHDLEAAELFCDRVLLVDGRIERELAFDAHRAPRVGPILAAWQESVGKERSPTEAPDGTGDRPRTGGAAGGEPSRARRALKPWQRIALTEIVEQRRQPSMLFILAANYLIWLAVFGVVLWMFDRAAADPEAMALVTAQLEGSGVEPDALLRLGVSTFGSLVFTNLPLYVAILSGYSVLHDRDTSALPFLMLAPVGRREMLLGKLAGALALPLVLHVVFVGAGCLVLGRLPVLAPFPLFGGGAAWWVAFLAGAPASAALVGAIGTVISALSSDVRTSMQYTSFFIGLLSLVFGWALVDELEGGVTLELGFAAGCAVLAGVALEIGARIVSRDLAA
ncbi:MAG: ATP-binding cassette domain-containing protein [Sandaracinus sp.]